MGKRAWGGGQGEKGMGRRTWSDFNFNQYFSKHSFIHGM